jgi:hypothetical protein
VNCWDGIGVLIETSVEIRPTLVASKSEVIEIVESKPGIWADVNPDCYSAMIRALPGRRVFGSPTWIRFVVASECIEVDKATIDVQLVVNEGCLMPIPRQKLSRGGCLTLALAR